MNDPGYIVPIGYCHDSEEDLLSQIPNDIIKLCCLYWSQKLKIVIHSNHQFQYLDVGSKQLSTFNQLQNSMCSDSFCYFNANSFQFDENLLYDGIISTTRKNFWETYLSIALFASNDIHEGNVEYKLFTSKQSLPRLEIDRFVAAGDNGIVYSAQGDLYQLKLSDIDTSNGTFGFFTYPLTASQGSMYGYQNSEHPSLTYLSRQNKIISVHLKKTETGYRYMFPVFDLDSGFNDWDRTYICDFKYDKLYSKYDTIKNTSARICEDDYDVDTMYTVFQDGVTLRYNFVKNKWMVIVKKKYKRKNIWEENLYMVKKNFVVWMDNYNVVACGDGRYFGVLDLRCNKSKWQEIRNIKCN